jgi:hypothetical protein
MAQYLADFAAKRAERAALDPVTEFPQSREFSREFGEFGPPAMPPAPEFAANRGVTAQIPVGASREFATA